MNERILQSKGSELEAAQRLTSLGAVVSFPFAEARYDLIADLDELYKVQVKSTDNDRISVDLRQHSYQSDGSVRSTTYDSSDVDVYVIHHRQSGEMYWVPYEDAPEKRIRRKVNNPPGPTISQRFDGD